VDGHLRLGTLLAHVEIAVERTRDPRLKEKIITYNVEDCAALEIVFHSVLRMSEHQGGDAKTESVVRVKSIRGTDSYRSLTPRPFERFRNLLEMNTLFLLDKNYNLRCYSS